MSPSYLGTSYSRMKWSRNVFQVSSQAMRWSWCRSLRWCVRIRSGEKSRLTLLEERLDLGALVREEAVAEAALEDQRLGRALEHRLGARARLLGARAPRR